MTMTPKQAIKRLDKLAESDDLEMAHYKGE